ncbi:MAG: sulfate adenylyltransferase [Alphaproteobacteria bacterium]|nr:sulfate adenylyltransferase [Alphaproteobacteria bacterium]MBF0249869.1 sulfate adenylyltransferase [Alphaproteobacteria bacterium]
MSQLVEPHGGKGLKPLLAPKTERADEIARAKNLKQVPMSSKETSDVLMFSMGAFTPLDGFMGRDDWAGACKDMKLKDGLFWPIPVTLSADKALADSIGNGEEVALVDAESGTVMAIMTVTEKFALTEEDKAFESQNVYTTTDMEHPGVQKVYAQKDVCLAGPLKVIDEGQFPKIFGDLYQRPAEARAAFADRGWSTVAAFQTRNPMHRSHEHLAKIAVEVTDGVYIHQVLGKLKAGDIPAETRTKAIQAMIDNYFVSGTVIQAGYPFEMRYAGPREALFHALIRQNYGCSHLIVGRDHAGVGDYYGPFDAQHIFDKLWDGALQTQPLKIDITFYCSKCMGMATAKTCPHDKSHHVSISGTKQREMLSAGQDIPPEFSRPEVVAILQEYYKGLK